MKRTTYFRVGFAIAAACTAIIPTTPLYAADIVAEWNSVTLPPAPELKPVSVEGGTTALLILDMMKTGCGTRPRCVASMPIVRKLHDSARAAGAMVFYTLVGGENPTPADLIDPATLPREGEWVFQGGPDKFLGSGLAERLAARGIKTVIVCGVTAQGAIIGTGSGAAQRNYQVIVPVDCMSSESAYAEQYTAWHMTKGAPVRLLEKILVTRSTVITFK